MDIEASKIIPKKQKGCKKRATDCKEQLIIDAVTLKLASKRNLYMFYIGLGFSTICFVL